MKVKCEAMVDTISTSQAHESNKTPVMAADDLSSKTIEFLRARLLAERATSKSARQEAQEIFEKVKDLHIRLETEIKHRKEAESAMEKVLSVLKAKGVVTNGIPFAANGILLAPTDVIGESMVRTASPSDFVIEAKEAPCKVEEAPHPMGDRNEKITQKGNMTTATELHQNPSMVEDSIDAFHAPAPNSVEKVCAPIMDIVAKHQHCLMEQAQDADRDKKVVSLDYNTPDHTLEDTGQGQSIQEGLCIASKLKAMLQQMEEEVGALPEEQPLRVKLQGLVGHVSNILDRGQEEGLEIDRLGSSSSKQPDVSCPTGVAALVTHIKLPAESKHTDSIHVNEAERSHTVDEMRIMAEGIDRRERRLVKSLFPGPKAQLQQSSNTPGIEGTSLHSSVDMFYGRKPSCDHLNVGYPTIYPGQYPPDRGPLPSQIIQYDYPPSWITCPPPRIHSSHITRGNNHMGLETPYLIEVPSPKSSDVGYVHGQHNEFWSPARASSGFEEHNAWSPARADGYFMNGNNNDVLYNHQNMFLQGGFAHSVRPRQAVDSRNRMIRGAATARQPLKDRLPFKIAPAHGMDDSNVRLGGVLMALDAARQRVQDEEYLGPPTPTMADARLKKGYAYGDCLCPESQQDAWGIHSHGPIVKFPPSPASEHGYSPFERRPSGMHRRSNSVSTDFMMSEWENHMQQPEGGEVHLGNGITLYTD